MAPKSSNFTEKYVKTFARFLCTFIKTVSFVGHVDCTDAESFKTSDDILNFLALFVQFKVHCRVDILCFWTNAHEKYSSAFLRRHIAIVG